MNETDLAFASIEEIRKTFAQAQTFAVELTKLMLAPIERSEVLACD